LIFHLWLFSEHLSESEGYRAAEAGRASRIGSVAAIPRADGTEEHLQ
jgi:hypothetical protein